PVSGAGSWCTHNNTHQTHTHSKHTHTHLKTHRQHPGQGVKRRRSQQLLNGIIKGGKLIASFLVIQGEEEEEG
ncbi:unnamed protein product, partial [Boreogadus saida]